MSRTAWLRAACVIAAIACLGLSPVARASETPVVPHGCASASSDYSIAVEPLARRVAVKVNSNEPCTFLYAEGDTFSGSGRFTVTCSSGGYYHHPDFQEGQYPPVTEIPIPQPCEVGATVTLDGYHQLTGGMVVGGGLRDAPSAPDQRLDEEDFRDLCAPESSPAATVDLAAPVDYSGLLTYSGTVRCDGADIDIMSLTITPLAGYSSASAGTASCKKCKVSISVSGTAPAQAWFYEVELKFDVTAPGRRTVTATRLGRYAVHWSGVVTKLCPGVESWDEDDTDVPPVDVPAGDTCPV